ncbi:hypothetical protein Rsub_10554 [Raphidocelis subcapitata]|uniref:Protein SCAI n=1 Tax=Raphidocelis subcapitata TaxID=307507 RepID=A0A2V0PGK3_9CHLO|nr:hypothetical protein Rsub_10554 [Raphidocelis subcapitata]|eukprot:GBF98142.1 hypothetical protein Rsub_10554 [Raphidocelis subcapitata]
MATREVFREFEYLLEKSQKSFNKLRDLPPYGNSRWEHHFHKAFHVYSKLWKFQQDHREALTARGMERWEIGDIASKIGQLYYNYYLRTSETRFLHEAYTFYQAINSRGYFAASGGDAGLAIKQLRYFARFIIICLLLGRRELVWQLLQEFQALITAYTLKHAPPDAAEWRAVIGEVTSFLRADVGMPLPRSPGAPLPFRASLRCPHGAPEVRLAPHKPLLLHAVMASYYPGQVKIAELPLDSFRMLQALEWEDAYSGGTAAPSAEPATPALRGAEANGGARRGPLGGGVGGGGGGGGSVVGTGGERQRGGGRAAGGEDGALPGVGAGSVAGSSGSAAASPFENPSKHLVYRPTSLQLLSILTTTVEVLPRDGILLLHVAAAGGRGELRGGGADAAAGGGAGGTASHPAAQGGEIAPHEADSPRPDSASDVSGLSLGALTVSHVAGEGGLNLGPAKAQDSADATLMPEDLLHLTRRTLFLVLDADNAANFAPISGRELSRTAFCLMSPAARPRELGEASTSGALLTMFLSAPLSGFCAAAGAADPTPAQLSELQAALGAVMGEWGALLLRTFGAAMPRSPWAAVFRDALLRRLVLRYVLCRASLALHATVGARPEHLPSCFPELPREVDPAAPEIAAGVQRLAACVGAGRVFAHAPAAAAAGRAGPSAR